MSAVTAEPRTAPPRGRPFTHADLEAMPDDGRRYEIVDGVLLVTPAPNYVHQRAVTRFVILLVPQVPNDAELLVAPFDVVLAEDTVMQPDVLVARRADFTRANLPAAPLLAIEVLSPSTRRVDLHLKRARFEAAGVLAYWVVDPDVPSLRAWELRDSAYVEVADVRGDEEFATEVPFPVRILPSALAAG
jgi:Uma2 family endonuclease